MNRTMSCSLAILMAFAGFAAYADSHEADGKVAASAEEIEPLKVGDKVPDVAFKNAAGETVNLHDTLAEKPALMIFFRGGWCPYCTKHLAAMRSVIGEVESLGYQVLAVSPDTVEEGKEIAKDKELEYTLLSDAGLEASKQFGIVFALDADTVEKYKGYKIDLDDTNWQLPVPTVLVVDSEGVIRYQHANPDYAKRLAPGDILAAAKKHQN